jgi:hypothetical protein
VVEQPAAEPNARMGQSMASVDHPDMPGGVVAVVESDVRAHKSTVLLQEPYFSQNVIPFFSREAGGRERN